MKSLCIVEDMFERNLPGIPQGFRREYTEDFFEQPADEELTARAEEVVSKAKASGIDVTICTTYNRLRTRNFLDVLANEEHDAYIIDGNFPVFFNKIYGGVLGKGVALAKGLGGKTEEIVSSFRGPRICGMDLAECWEMDDWEREVRMDFARYENRSLSDILSKQAGQLDVSPEQVKRLVAAAERGDDAGIDFMLGCYAGAIALSELSARKKNYVLFTQDPAHGCWSVALSLFNGLLDVDACRKNFEYIGRLTSKEEQGGVVKNHLDGQEIVPGAAIFGSRSKMRLYSGLIERMRETF